MMMDFYTCGNWSNPGTKIRLTNFSIIDQCPLKVRDEVVHQVVSRIHVCQPQASSIWKQAA